VTIPVEKIQAPGKAEMLFQGLFSFQGIMAILTYTEQLESVQAAIQAIESGVQSYSISGRTMTRADLSVLYEREERLLPLARRESSGRKGCRVRYVEVG
jgi:hypothetical protein